MVTATVYCAPAPLRAAVLGVYCLGSLIGLYKAMRAWSPWERRLCFAAPFCMRLMLAGTRAALLGGGDPHAILHVFLQPKGREAMIASDDRRWTDDIKMIGGTILSRKAINREEWKQLEEAYVSRYTLITEPGNPM
ncbi:hypothetical protein EVAR_6591_1 [Eumeta japonica]|uniref:Uncharacterized protein n=1 Tax=Eumeta variegata TaxID=151549 RepID=A0A4C1TN49_EUMVA|nr:hypothetical protein EVAR_6591_1 [Eumeta japonica]